MAADDEQNLAELLRALATPYSKHIAETPQPVRRRIRALKKLRSESINVETKYYQRAQELEKEFQPLFQELQKKRVAIVTGEHEPTEAECDEKLLHIVGEDELKKLEATAPVERTPSKGIPDFWFHALQNKRQTRNLIKEHDEPILKHLTDISEEIHSDPDGFTLRFHFAANEYFDNTVLEKYYKLQVTPDAENPFDYNGPTATATKGTKIEWKHGMDVTQTAVEYVAGPITTTTVKTGSFFNFFDPTAAVTSKGLSDKESESFRENFKVADIIRNEIILRAVFFYTGEAAEHRRGPWRMPEHLAETPQPVRRRIRALKKLQIESDHVEGKYYQREHEIDKELHPLCDEIHKKRTAIVTGQHEPTDAECDEKLLHIVGDDELKKLEATAPVEGTPSKGIPDFWYYALKGRCRIGDIMEEDSDKPILKHLTDITSEIHSDPCGVTLRFHFEPNEYFSNAVLEKYYKLQLTADAEDPSRYDGPKATATNGTKIAWKDGMNVTQKVVEYIAGPIVTTIEKEDSFFNFFDPPVTEMSKGLSVTDRKALRLDFDIGKDIFDLIIPRAVFFYTGEMGDDDDLDSDDNLEDGEDEENEPETIVEE